MYLVTVLLLSKKARTDILSYFHNTHLPIGTLVEVPFRGKPMRAIVTESRPVEEVKDMIKNASFQLKKVTKVLGENKFPKELFSVIAELSDFYLTSFSRVIDDVIPEAAFEEMASESIPVTNTVTPVPALFMAEASDRMSWYKTRIRELFAQKKSMYIACPTEREAEMMYATLSRGIEERAVLISSGLSKKKLIEALEKIKNKTHPLCIFGTASFATIPRKDLDTIVIEHESSQNYRRVIHPFIDMRLFLELYGRSRKLSVILADTLPRMETYQRFTDGELTEIHPISFHPELPEREEIISREKRTERGRFRMITEQMEEEIVRIQKNGSKVFLFALRNGLASMTICRDCGEVVTCEHCGAPLALYRTGDKRVFVCNACKLHAPSDSACSRCDSWNLHPYGVGIESVYDECAERFPNAPLFRIDKASVKNDKEAQKIADEFQKSSGAILVGTELALHYLTEKVPMVGVTSFDSLFHIPSYRVSERIVEFVTSLRDKASKLLAVQTMYPDDRLLTITTKPKLFAWYKDELAERAEFNYPPHSTLIKVVGHFPKNHLAETRELLTARLGRWTPDIFTGISFENKNYTKLTALIRVPKKSWWFSSLGKNTIDEPLKEALRSLQAIFTIHVNPEDLL